MSFYTKLDAGSTYHALMIGELPNPSKNKQTNKVFSIFSSKLMVSQNRTNKATLPTIGQTGAKQKKKVPIKSPLLCVLVCTID